MFRYSVSLILSAILPIKQMSIYALKPRFQNLLRPLVERLAAARVTANQVTMLAAAGSIAVGAAVAWLAAWRPIFIAIPIWLAARMALNAVDGMLAREHGQKSRLGFYLNEIADVVSDAALYAPFALVAPFGPFGIGALILLSMLTEFAGVLGPGIGATRRYDGPMGKSDRAAVFGALGLWIGLSLPLPDWVGWGVAVVAALLIVTVVNRVRGGLDEISHAGGSQ
jgi:CDP-diacylglycerol--glycerol-3-phosphate 3-phosphatidyltransferase